MMISDYQIMKIEENNKNIKNNNLNHNENKALKTFKGLNNTCISIEIA